MLYAFDSFAAGSCLRHFPDLYHPFAVTEKKGKTRPMPYVKKTYDVRLEDGIAQVIISSHTYR